MNKNIFKYDDMKRSEHMAVRNNVGWYFWTHQLIEVTGPDVVPFLDYLYTGNIASLAVGRDRYTTMLNEQGEIIDDVDETYTRLTNGIRDAIQPDVLMQPKVDNVLKKLIKKT